MVFLFYLICVYLLTGICVTCGLLLKLDRQQQDNMFLKVSRPKCLSAASAQVPGSPVIVVVVVAVIQVLRNTDVRRRAMHVVARLGWTWLRLHIFCTFEMRPKNSKAHTKNTRQGHQTHWKCVKAKKTKKTLSDTSNNRRNTGFKIKRANGTVEQ